MRRFLSTTRAEHFPDQCFDTRPDRPACPFTVTFDARTSLRILLLTLLIVTPSVLQGADTRVKQIDRHNASEKNRYYVVFCARGGSPAGHAFVALGMDDFDAKACRLSAFGLYPQTTAKGIASLVLGPVPGKIVDESFASRTSYRLIVQVNSPQFNKAVEICKKWAAKGKYELLERDCVTFVQEIANALGLKTPKRRDALLPQTFIRELMKLND